VRTKLVPSADTGQQTDHDQAAIRTLLATVSIADLREIGVLEPLLQLAGRVRTADRQDSSANDAIDQMELSDLVQTALDGELR
jgi:hypothetical protein